RQFRIGLRRPTGRRFINETRRGRYEYRAQDGKAVDQYLPRQQTEDNRQYCRTEQDQDRPIPKARQVLPPPGHPIRAWQRIRAEALAAFQYLRLGQAAGREWGHSLFG